MIFLDEKFKKMWFEKDPFLEVQKLDGDTFRNLENRRTLRFEVNGNGFFLKFHKGVGWHEIFKNLIMLKTPVLGAGNEYKAICHLEELGLSTTKVAAFGRRGKNPAKRRSFIITKELVNTLSLEDFCRDWPQNPPSFASKKLLIEKLAWMSRQMHTNGMNHRDYYICHFLLDVSALKEKPEPEDIKLHLIDLHRAQIRDKIPIRWIIKDLAGLWFSAMDVGLSKRDLFRFMTIYSGRSVRDIFSKERKFWNQVHKKACRLYQHQQKKCNNYGGKLKIQAHKGVDKDWVGKVAKFVFSCYTGGLYKWEIPDNDQIWKIHLGERAGVLGLNLQNRSCCVKLFYDDRVCIKLRNRLGFSKARRAFLKGLELHRRKILSPAILAWSVDYTTGLTLLITELISDAKRVDKLIQEEGLTYQLIENLAYFIRNMHNAGVAHNDLSLRNIFVAQRNGKFCFWLLDYEDTVFFNKISRWQRLKDLHHLNERALAITKLKHRLFFLRCYLKDKNKLKVWTKDLREYILQHSSKYTKSYLKE